MGKLERKLDLDLIARMKAGQIHKLEPLKRQKSPRHYTTYRGWKRNQAIHGGSR